jgi:membrane associated rhomboid family serine protease
MHDRPPDERHASRRHSFTYVMQESPSVDATEVDRSIRHVARAGAMRRGPTSPAGTVNAMAQRLGSDRIAGLKLLFALIAVMWVTEAIDAADGHHLDQYGIHPRDVGGLPEIFSAPFLHVGWDHLISNTIPFAAMGLAIALGGLARVALVTLIVGVVSGLGVWLIAPSHTVVLGASGIVFGYATYLVARGILSRRLVEIGVGVVVIGVFGLALLQSLVPHEGISWQAHLFGAIGGVIAASVVAGRREPAPAALPRPVA